jgi:hypothetical protein
MLANAITIPFVLAFYFFDGYFRVHEPDHQALIFKLFLELFSLLKDTKSPC